MCLWEDESAVSKVAENRVSEIVNDLGKELMSAKELQKPKPRRERAKKAA